MMWGPWVPIVRLTLIGLPGGEVGDSGGGVVVVMVANHGGVVSRHGDILVLVTSIASVLWPGLVQFQSHGLKSRRVEFLITGTLTLLYTWGLLRVGWVIPVARLYSWRYKWLTPSVELHVNRGVIVNQIQWVTRDPYT